MRREECIERIRRRDEPWDITVIGGGATGVGIALDAASRGLSVLLIEQADFGKGTSSRSTKLVHGGVRYLRQGDISLVRDALHERTLLRNNAPHLVHDMQFVIPCQSWWQRFFYGIGLKVYDILAVRNSFGRSHGVSRSKLHAISPALKSSAKLRGGVVYHDGQFDDTRLLINMARTAHDHGAALVNYCAVESLRKDDDEHVVGVVAKDLETGETFQVASRAVVNATGPFCDGIRKMDDPKCESMISPSQGIHIVLPREFYPGEAAMIVPKTSDGRVIFVVPWHEHAIVGTTDTGIDSPALEPNAQDQEIEFLLTELTNYLQRAPSREDVLSVFVGIRPLVKAGSVKTASLSRDHTIQISDSGLITITGGKWTTVRKMAEDCVDQTLSATGIQAKDCVTKTLRIHGYEQSSLNERAFYGSDLLEIRKVEEASPKLASRLHPDLPLFGSDVVWAARFEMARTLEDVLARRNRSLFLNSRAAFEAAPEAAGLLASELGQDEAWAARQIEDFRELARKYRAGLVS